MALDQIKSSIKAACGLEFQDDKEALLTKALAERMQATGTASGADYLQLIQASKAELAELIDLVTINETYFFREPEQIQLLTESLLPELMAYQGERPLRILSLGCSHGEEPYSLAMALEQQLGTEALAQEVHIQGADIDRKALAKARMGIYGDFAFRGLAPEWVERYFSRLGPGQYQILPRLGAWVEFHHLNLLDEHWPRSLLEQDVVFFRNVSIYFDEPHRRQIQAQICKALRPDGILFMSATETLSNDFDLMALCQQEDIFFFRNRMPGPEGTRPKGTAPTSPAQTSPVPSGQPVFGASLLSQDPGPQATRPTLDTQKLLAQALEQARQGQLNEALALTHHLLALADAEAQAKLEQQRLLASLLFLKEDFSAAEQAIRQALAEDDLEPKALFLLAQIQRWQEQRAAAMDSLKKVLYSQPNHWQAHFLLGDCHRQQGQTELARRSYRRVLQLLQRPPEANPDPIQALTELPVGKLALLAERRLAALASESD